MYLIGQVPTALIRGVMTTIVVSQTTAYVVNQAKREAYSCLSLTTRVLAVSSRCMIRFFLFYGLTALLVCKIVVDATMQSMNRE